MIGKHFWFFVSIYRYTIPIWGTVHIHINQVIICMQGQPGIRSNYCITIYIYIIITR